MHIYIDRFGVSSTCRGRIGGGRRAGGVDGDSGGGRPRGSNGGCRRLKRWRGGAGRTARAQTNDSGEDEGLYSTKTKELFRSRAPMHLYMGGLFRTGP